MGVRTELRSGPEFDRVRRLLAAAGAGPDDPAVLRGPGDDGLVLDPPEGERIVLSVDQSVEEVHFRRAWLGWETVGYRAVAAAMSDLAGMAARPLGVLVSLALPPELDAGILDELGGGIGACLREHGGTLLGGDLSRSPGPVVLDVVVVGAAADPVPRDGGRPGDELWVTGRLGGAAAAALDWSRAREPDPRARRAFCRPPVRIEEARWLHGRVGLSALLDLSDGLAGDAAQLAAASGLRAEIRLPDVPMAEVLEGFRDREVALRRALGGGEDYELLLAVGAGEMEPLRAEFERTFGVALTRVGRLVEGRGLAWLDAENRERPSGVRGHDHFGAGSRSDATAKPSSGEGGSPRASPSDRSPEESP